MSSVKEIKEDESALCTVTRIESAAVFVNIDEYNQEGTITLSEISPGRIRNIREFVSVGKKIVCKVLRKNNDRIELSLRRVSAKERDSILEHYKKERDKLKEILSQKKESEKEVQKKITLKSDDEDGIIHIRKILETKEADISYLGSSNFLIRVKGKEYKTANNQLEKVLAEIKEKAKKAHAHLEIK